MNEELIKKMTSGGELTNEEKDILLRSFVDERIAREREEQGRKDEEEKRRQSRESFGIGRASRPERLPQREAEAKDLVRLSMEMSTYDMPTIQTPFESRYRDPRRYSGFMPSLDELEREAKAPQDSIDSHEVRRLIQENKPVRIEDYPKFYGNEDKRFTVDEWILAFDRYAALQELPERKKRLVALACLEGSAREWRDGFSVETKYQTWTSFTNALTENFRDPRLKRITRDKLKGLYWRKDEGQTLTSYGAQFSQLSAMLILLGEDMSEEAKIESYLDGLRSAEHILMFTMGAQERPRTLNDTMLAIQRIHASILVARASETREPIKKDIPKESRRKDTIAEPKKERPTSTTTTTNSNDGNKGLEAKKAEADKDRKSKKERFAEMECFRCGRKGHPRKYCKETTHIDGHTLMVISIAGESLRVDGEIEGDPIQICLDSQSSLNLISLSYFSKRVLPTTVNKNEIRRIIVANGEWMDTLGSIKLSTTIDKKEKVCEYHVVNCLPVMVLLGYAGLQLFGLTVKFGGKTRVVARDDEGEVGITRCREPETLNEILSQVNTEHVQFNSTTRINTQDPPRGDKLEGTGLCVIAPLTHPSNESSLRSNEFGNDFGSEPNMSGQNEFSLPNIEAQGTILVTDIERCNNLNTPLAQSSKEIYNEVTLGLDIGSDPSVVTHASMYTHSERCDAPPLGERGEGHMSAKGRVVPNYMKGIGNHTCVMGGLSHDSLSYDTHNPMYTQGESCGIPHSGEREEGSVSVKGRVNPNYHKGIENHKSEVGSLGHVGMGQPIQFNKNSTIECLETQLSGKLEGGPICVNNPVYPHGSIPEVNRYHDVPQKNLDSYEVGVHTLKSTQEMSWEVPLRGKMILGPMSVTHPRCIDNTQVGIIDSHVSFGKISTLGICIPTSPPVEGMDIQMSVDRVHPSMKVMECQELNCPTARECGHDESTISSRYELSTSTPSLHIKGTQSEILCRMNTPSAFEIPQKQNGDVRGGGIEIEVWDPPNAMSIVLPSQPSISTTTALRSMPLESNTLKDASEMTNTEICTRKNDNQNFGDLLSPYRKINISRYCKVFQTPSLSIGLKFNLCDDARKRIKLCPDDKTQGEGSIMRLAGTCPPFHPFGITTPLDETISFSTTPSKWKESKALSIRFDSKNNRENEELLSCEGFVNPYVCKSKMTNLTEGKAPMFINLDGYLQQQESFNTLCDASSHGTHKGLEDVRVNPIIPCVTETCLHNDDTSNTNSDLNKSNECHEGDIESLIEYLRVFVEHVKNHKCMHVRHDSIKSICPVIGVNTIHKHVTGMRRKGENNVIKETINKDADTYSVINTDVSSLSGMVPIFDIRVQGQRAKTNDLCCLIDYGYDAMPEKIVNHYDNKLHKYKGLLNETEVVHLPYTSCEDFARNESYHCLMLESYDDSEKMNLDEDPESFPATTYEQVMKDIIIPERERDWFQDIVHEYGSVFNVGPKELGNCSGFVYELLMKDHHPFVSRPYHLGEAENRVVEAQIEDEMLPRGVIQPSKSPYRNPIFVIWKKDGTGRFILDARRINEYLIKDNFPLPYIRDLLDDMKGCRYFSHMDLLSGYWQIGLKEEDRPKTAFSTRRGLFEFKVMPFGVATAPAAFQRLIQSILHPVLGKGVCVYIDDIVIYTKTLEEHRQLLLTVLRLLKKAGLRVKPSKCKFFQHKMTVLGHVVSEEGIQVDEEKVASIKEIPTPKNVKALQRFLGSANYYRNFIDHYSVISAPLHALVSKNVSYHWTDECEYAFQKLKDELCKAPVLTQPDFTKPFIVVTDASTTGLGGYVAQLPDGIKIPDDPMVIPSDLRVIAYCSKKLHGAEKNYSATELEGLGVLYALSKFRTYVLGHEVHVYTDHSALRHIQRNSEPVSSRLQRFVSKIMVYNPIIHYVKGSTNTLADALSRMHYDESNAEGKRSEHITMVVHEHESSQISSLSAERFGDSQREDEECLKIIENIDKEQNYTLIDDVLYRRNIQGGRTIFQLVVPKRHRNEILSNYHDGGLGGHQGVARTFERVRTRYYWTNYHNDVKNYVKTCPVCQRSDKSNGSKVQSIPVLPFPVSDVFETMGIDVIGPLPTTERGNKYIVMMVDHGSKWTEAFATGDVTSKTIASLIFENIICRFGPPKKLHSDRGSNFLSRVLKKLCDLFTIHKTNTTAYHPSCNGQVERLNGVVVGMIRKIVMDNEEDWDIHLPAALFAYRTTPHSVTNLSPYQLVYGREPRLPIDMALGELIQTSPNNGRSYEELLDSMTAMRSYARSLMEETSGHRISDEVLYENPYHAGDRVWLYTPVVKEGKSKKLVCFWKGPYEVKEIISPVNCIVDIGSNNRYRVHISRLKTFYSRKERPADYPIDLRLDEVLEEPNVNEDVEKIDQSVLSENLNPTSKVADETTQDPNAEIEVPDAIINGKEYFEVGKILDWKYVTKNGRKERRYLVRWKNFSEKSDSWEPYSGIRDTNAIEEFHKAHPELKPSVRMRTNRSKVSMDEDRRIIDEMDAPSEGKM